MAKIGKRGKFMKFIFHIPAPIDSVLSIAFKAPNQFPSLPIAFFSAAFAF